MACGDWSGGGGGEHGAPVVEFLFEPESFEVGGVELGAGAGIFCGRGLAFPEEGVGDVNGGE